MRRFNLNKTQNIAQCELQNQQQNGLAEPKNAKYIEQQTKIEILLKQGSHPEQIELFKKIMHSSIENYDAKLVEFIPNEPTSEEFAPTSQFLKHKPKSLAEATLITNFQLFSYGCQTILASCVPLMIEQYRLSLIQKNTQSDHLQQLEVVKFGHELSQRLVLPYQAYNQDFARDLEQIFKLCLLDSKLSEELEKQELTLGRIDYAKENVKEQIVSDHVRNYPVLLPYQLKNVNVDNSINHAQFFTENIDEEKIKQSQNQQILRIIDKLKVRKEQLINELNQ